MSSTDMFKRLLACGLLTIAVPAAALQTDRQQPLEVRADSTDGTLGDGTTTLKGHVEIRQGSLLIRADEAEVDKSDGKVGQIVLRGGRAYLEQEIEEQGQVKAWAALIEYRVGSGMVTFSGDAQVEHPQYSISGDHLTYDLNVQHFEGTSAGDGNGRIHIRLDPEIQPEAGKENSEKDPQDNPAPADKGESTEGN